MVLLKNQYTNLQVCWCFLSCCKHTRRFNNIFCSIVTPRNLCRISGNIEANSCKFLKSHVIEHMKQKLIYVIEHMKQKLRTNTVNCKCYRTKKCNKSLYEDKKFEKLEWCVTLIYNSECLCSGDSINAMLWKLCIYMVTDQRIHDIEWHVC